jgi:hypothetical protein
MLNFGIYNQALLWDLSCLFFFFLKKIRNTSRALGVHVKMWTQFTNTEAMKNTAIQSTCTHKEKPSDLLIMKGKYTGEM